MGGVRTKGAMCVIALIYSRDMCASYLHAVNVCEKVHKRQDVCVKYIHIVSSSFSLRTYFIFSV